MRGVLMVVAGMCLLGVSVSEGAELVSHDRGFNWQDREYFGAAYVYQTLAGGESAASGESGDAGAAAGATGPGGGESGGNGCTGDK